jgi:hypothetical protein
VDCESAGANGQAAGLSDLLVAVCTFSSMRCDARVERSTNSFVCRVAWLNEVTLQLGDLLQGFCCCDRLGRRKGRLSVGRQVLDDLLIEQLRVAPGSIGDLRHRFRPVLRRSSGLLAECLGRRDALLGNRLEVARHGDALEEVLDLVKGVPSELLSHGACPR